ncbi:hypothetical protein M9H77_15538 [Catharanthus roseus]|uniref:Uncharacterized protein n=1 Tax=Catharanthus roseus TaxID=4058 RepID=A0ACC0AZC1_CATRO|nr:hypothetical protein M9H77_15538 [Catharanthus roseus]
MSTPKRAPTWFSARRLFERKLSELHHCTDLNQVNQIHAIIYKSNLHRDSLITAKLISAFSLCRRIDSAIKVFNQIEKPDLHLYNVFVRAQILDSQSSQAFATFFEMQINGVLPDTFTYSFLLKACSDQSWFKVVTLINTHLIKYGLFDDVLILNSLVNSYLNCGLMGFCLAEKLFSIMVDRDAVTYNCMLSGLVKVGKLDEALKLFDEMPERDTVSWNIVLDGYVRSGDLNLAIELFEKMPSRDSVSWCTLISGYSKSGDLKTARILFEKMPAKNLVAWTTIIAAYAAKGIVKEAIALYDQMQVASMKPDEGTIIGILAACAASGVLGLGERIHYSLNKSGYRCSTRVLNTLIDMYAKCGSLNGALTIFNGMEKKDITSWSTMIHASAIHGHGEMALHLFSKMKQEGFAPDRVTFIGILSACNHTGLVDEGIHLFYTMEKDYGVVPEIVHYGCMIDLLGRGGRLKEAFRLVQNMPFEPNNKIWGALIGACRKHYAVALAEEELKHLLQLDFTDSGSLSMLSSIYAISGDWNNFANARLRMRNIGCGKPSGASSVEVDNEFHEFTAMDQSHPKCDMVYEMIDGLTQHIKMRAAGHGAEAHFNLPVPVDDFMQRSTDQLYRNN